MSHTRYYKPARLQRSELAVPGDQPGRVHRRPQSCEFSSTMAAALSKRFSRKKAGVK